jgi:5-formyltetrahydrofolate cyclo-ligase
MTVNQSIRKRINDRRLALSDDEQQQAALQVAEHFLASPLSHRGKHIAGYWAINGELDVEPVLGALRNMNKTCYLPVLDTLTENRLWFAPYDDTTRLVLNRFGIPEPLGNRRQRTRATRLDIILVPLTAFDKRGNRLGMGCGYYDRTLAFLQRRRHWQKPLLIGMAYDFQRVDSLEANPWDVPLDMVITEKGIMAKRD